MTIRVTVLDTETGDTETKDVPEHDYVLICSGDCHISYSQVSAKSGTHNLTIKRGPQPQERAS